MRLQTTAKKITSAMATLEMKTRTRTNELSRYFALLIPLRAYLVLIESPPPIILIFPQRHHRWQVQCEIIAPPSKNLEEIHTSESVSHLNDAVEHFQFVLDLCPVGHPDRPVALTNLAWAHHLI